MICACTTISKMRTRICFSYAHAHLILSAQTLQIWGAHANLILVCALYFGAHVSSGEIFFERYKT